MSEIDAAYPGPGAPRRLRVAGVVLWAATVALVPAAGIAREATVCAAPPGVQVGVQVGGQAGGPADAIAGSDDGPTGDVVPPRRPPMVGPPEPDAHGRAPGAPAGLLDVPAPQRRAAPGEPSLADRVECGRERDAG